MQGQEGGGGGKGLGKVVMISNIPMMKSSMGVQQRIKVKVRYRNRSESQQEDAIHV